MEESSTYTIEEREYFRKLTQEKNGMDLEKQILSDITVHMKYARYLEDKQRRENWEELVTRNMEMHIKKFPHIEQEIRKNYKMVFDKKSCYFCHQPKLIFVFALLFLWAKIFHNL